MKQIIILLCVGVFFALNQAHAGKVFYGKDNFKAEASGSFEFIENWMDNQRDLNSSINDDELFPAVQYGTNLDLTYSGLPLEQGDVILHSLIERKGRLGYAANLAKVDLTDTRELPRYRWSQDLLPRMRELYVNTPLGVKGLRTMLGLHKHTLGWTGQLFGGKDPNYGVTLMYTLPLPTSSLVYHFHWDKPDYNNKWRIQFKRPTQEDNESSNRTSASRFETDISYYWDYNVIQLMASFLSDKTGNPDRLVAFFDNITSEKDEMGNVGASYIQYLGDDVTVYTEGAMNFGALTSTGAGGNGGNVEHRGWMWGIKMAYNPAYWIQPSVKLLYFSGNDISREDVQFNNTNRQGINKGYMGGYSLGNENLADTINTPISGGFPLLCMAGLHGVMKGVGRPGSFNDPTGKENLIMGHLSLNMSWIEKLTTIVDYFSLWADNPGLGQFGSANNIRALDAHLGQELNLILSYPVMKYLTVTNLSAYFIPGRYYNKSGRTDTNPLSFSPVVGNGTADNAVASEIAFKWWF